MSNMKIWNAVKETDPNHTKKVAQRGGFTAIDAQYTVQKATEVFGPVGLGWGYRADYELLDLGDDKVISCQVELWHGERSNTFGPFIGMNVLYDGKRGRIDDDAGKKAMTDALTKGLSHLGFGADVFLGQYDDNKYMSEISKKYGMPVAKPTVPSSNDF